MLAVYFAEYIVVVVVIVCAANWVWNVLKRGAGLFRELANAKLDFIARVDRFAYENYGNDSILLFEITQYSRYVLNAMEKHSPDVPTFIRHLNAIEPWEICNTVIQYRNT